MKTTLRDQFVVFWNKYFPGAELPIVFQYSNDTQNIPVMETPPVHRCLIAQLARTRRGESLCLQASSSGCRGGKRYTNFTDRMFPGFECFISHNEQGAGERYKQTPELTEACIGQLPVLPIKGENLIFKRWDKLEEMDAPEVVIFFATPDVISGLFTLTCFDNATPDAVITPFGAGCASIIYHPYQEQIAGTNRAVLGLFDPSARKCIKENILSFAIPFSKFEKMVAQMEESFLITDTWEVIKKRIRK